MSDPSWCRPLLSFLRSCARGILPPEHLETAFRAKQMTHRSTPGASSDRGVDSAGASVAPTLTGLVVAAGSGAGRRSLVESAGRHRGLLHLHLSLRRRGGGRSFGRADRCRHACAHGATAHGPARLVGRGLGRKRADLTNAGRGPVPVRVLITDPHHPGELQVPGFAHPHAFRRAAVDLPRARAPRTDHRERERPNDSSCHGCMVAPRSGDVKKCHSRDADAKMRNGSSYAGGFGPGASPNCFARTAAPPTPTDSTASPRA